MCDHKENKGDTLASVTAMRNGKNVCESDVIHIIVVLSWENNVCEVQVDFRFTYQTLSNIINKDIDLVYQADGIIVNIDT
jgi:hypothetical protein